MAEEHAELFKIGVGQVRQNVPVDAVVVERRFVLAKPETFEPTPTTVTFPSGPALIIIRIGWPVHDRAIRSHRSAGAFAEANAGRRRCSRAFFCALSL